MYMYICYGHATCTQYCASINIFNMPARHDDRPLTNNSRVIINYSFVGVVNSFCICHYLTMQDDTMSLSTEKHRHTMYSINIRKLYVQFITANLDSIVTHYNN